MSLFKAAKTKSKRGTSSRDASILPVIPADVLLSTKRRQKIVKNIRSLVKLSTREFEALYLKTLFNFAEFVQHLPETSSSYFSHQGGMLDHALERAHIALTACSSYLDIPKDDVSDTNSIYELWVFAIFSAALLKDVGKIAEKLHVILLKKGSKENLVWSPYKGSMYNQGSYYRYTFEKENRDRLRTLVTPLLARQILTGDSESVGDVINPYQWIASDKVILEAWLEMLNEAETGGGRALMVLPYADAQTIASYFASTKQHTDGIPNKYLDDYDLIDEVEREEKEKAYTDEDKEEADRELTKSKENVSTGTILGSIASDAAMMLTAGEAFLNWLKLGIKDGRLGVNKANSSIHRVGEGVFIEYPRVMQDFARSNPQFGTWQDVLRQFNQLDLTVSGIGANSIHQYFLRNAEFRKIHEGIVVHNPFIIFDPKAMPPVNPHLIKISAESVKPEPVLRSSFLQTPAPKAR